MDRPRLTDVEMEMFARQKRENRKAIVTLIGLVGGLSGLAVLLASLSKSGHESDRAVVTVSESKVAARPSAVPTPAPAASTAPAAVPTPPVKPSVASADDVKRLVHQQEQSSVNACIAHAGKRVAPKTKVTVKMELKAPAQIARLEVTATPKSPKVVNCVKSELKGFAVPRLAGNMVVSVPFKLETAQGRRPLR